MKKCKVIIFLLIIIITLTGCGVKNEKNVNENSNINSKQLTEKEKLDDFEYMYKILDENYPFFGVNKRLNGVDWLAKKEEYINRIKATPNDESFFYQLSKILSELNNGHAYMVDKDNYSELKSYYENHYDIRKAWIEQVNKTKSVERYTSVKENSNTSPENISSENIKSNNVETMDLEKGKVAYISIHSFLEPYVDQDMKIIKPYLEGIKNYKTLIIDIRGNGGGTGVYWSEIVDMLLNKVVEDKYYMAFRGGDFDEQFLENQYGIGYEKLGSISDLDKENLKKLPPELKEDFEYYYEFVNKYEPLNSIGFNGKIYLIVDRNVFSASEQFATFSKSTGFATLVGEKTGGDGIGFEPAICSLPNSGYLFRYSEEMGLTSDGTCNFEEKTTPDIAVYARKTQDISNDEAIQTVLKLVN